MRLSTWRSALGGVFLALGLTACGDLATGPRDVPRANPVIMLPVLPVYTCQYGGEYPFCRSDLPTGEEEGHNGSGGGTPPAPTPPDSTTECDPQVDPTCEKKLSSTDSTLILSALRQFVRPDTTIADTANRRRCGDLVRKFQERFAAGKVYRGRYDTEGNTAHYGATYDRHIHFDPWLLNKAANDPTVLRELANTALHEAAHTLDFWHPSGPDALGRYTDPPFNLLDPGPNVCLS